MKFEKYLVKELKALAADEPVDRDLLNVRLQVYFGLLLKGVEPMRARRIMDIYIKGD